MIVTDEMIERARLVYDEATSSPQLITCERCGGKGYHHVFSDSGNDPDWCENCGGGGYDVLPGEEDRAMRAALEAALSPLPAAEAIPSREDDRIAKLEEALEFYADPGTYYGIGFLPNAHCGDFVDDFDEDHEESAQLGFKPGKRARAALSLLQQKERAR